ncbi:MAG: hypothetical protein JO081_00220 [Alphaproteobacteria bacterium]|nr:hypothetical protein [Alphaproteobacteria bacterium]
MTEIVADRPDSSCSLLLCESGIQESQLLGPDPFQPRARDARRRFTKDAEGSRRFGAGTLPRPATNGRAFAADLLQMRQRPITNSIYDCIPCGGLDGSER